MGERVEGRPSVSLSLLLPSHSSPLTSPAYTSRSTPFRIGCPVAATHASRPATRSRGSPLAAAGAAVARRARVAGARAGAGAGARMEGAVARMWGGGGGNARGGTGGKGGERRGKPSCVLFFCSLDPPIHSRPCAFDLRTATGGAVCARPPRTGGRDTHTRTPCASRARPPRAPQPPPLQPCGRQRPHSPPGARTGYCTVIVA